MLSISDSAAGTLKLVKLKFSSQDDFQRNLYHSGRRQAAFIYNTRGGLFTRCPLEALDDAKQIASLQSIPQQR
jgi:hypothetical protein